jgi:hypothetical protein
MAPDELRRMPVAEFLRLPSTFDDPELNRARGERLTEIIGGESGSTLDVKFDVLTARRTCELPDPATNDELLGPLVVRGQRTVIGAHTGEGKTTMTLQIVRAIAAGEEFLGWRGPGDNRALIVDAEQGLRTIKRRLREARLDESDAVDYLRVPDGLRLDTDRADADEVERLLSRGGYAVVGFDPLYKLHSGDSNAERAAVDLMRLFDSWRTSFHFGLLLPVHLRKPIPGEKFSIHDVFGSSAYTRGAEVVLGLRRVSNGYAELHFFKDRDGDLEIGHKWGLLYDAEHGFRRAAEDDVVDSETYAQRLLAYVRQHPGESTTKVTTEVEGRKATLTEILRNDNRFRSERVSNADRWYETDAQDPFPGLGNGRERVSPADGDRGVPPAGITPVGGYPSGTPASSAGPGERERPETQSGERRQLRWDDENGRYVVEGAG